MDERKWVRMRRSRAWSRISGASVCARALDEAKKDTARDGTERAINDHSYSTPPLPYPMSFFVFILQVYCNNLTNLSQSCHPEPHHTS